MRRSNGSSPEFLNKQDNQDGSDQDTRYADERQRKLGVFNQQDNQGDRDKNHPWQPHQNRVSIGRSVHPFHLPRFARKYAEFFLPFCFLQLRVCDVSLILRMHQGCQEKKQTATNKGQHEI